MMLFHLVFLFAIDSTRLAHSVALREDPGDNQGPSFSPDVSHAAPATFRTAAYYQDGMVLQRGEPGPCIWGFGEPSQPVGITFEKLQLNGTVNDDGLWRICLPATEAGGPFEIQLTSMAHNLTVVQVLRSILFGDVWLCSGQSNMEFQVQQMFNGSEELKSSSLFEQIRFVHVLTSESPTPLLEPAIYQVWSSPSPVTLKEFSGLCWAVGRRLYEKLNIPIGLIGSYVGGTPIRAWSSREVMDSCNTTTPSTGDLFFRDILLGSAYNGTGDDSVLWNAMIAPFRPLGLAGFLWYQGEADAAGKPDAYRCLFPAMIGSWRKEFRRPELPFGFVQLSDQTDEDKGTPLVRWHQTADIGVVPNDILSNVFMAVAMDLADPQSPYGSIHPRYKEEIADRLVAGAFSLAYNISVPFHGPFPIKLTNRSSMIKVRYQHGPIVAQKNRDTDFEVCCDSKQKGRRRRTHDWTSCASWKAAPVVDVADHVLSVDASACKLDKALFVRYSWRTTPCLYMQCAVYGRKTHLPAPPFVLPVQ